MPNNNNPSSLPLTRKKYTPAFKAECVRQVAVGARQTDVARAQGLFPALPNLTSTAATLPWATARPTNLNANS